MGRVFLDATTSLDGFVAGPNVSLAHPLGEGGMCLHDWLFLGNKEADGTVDREVADEMFANTGAFVMGRTMFDVGEGPWGDDGAFGKPCFVLTHRAREPLVRGPTTFNFVTDGLESALAQAIAAAEGKDVGIPGSATVAQQCLRAGLLDELRIHVAPVLLGAGTRLFDGLGSALVKLQRTRVLQSSFVTHFVYRVLR
jgi:dihydrofolate reductase